jgi:hypothetical protein
VNKGYVSEPLKMLLKESGLEFLTKLKKNMKPQAHLGNRQNSIEKMGYY